MTFQDADLAFLTHSSTSRIEQPINIQMPMKMMSTSRVFASFVEATAFRWNTAGKMNATGVQLTAPRRDKKSSRLSPRAIVNPIENATSKVLDRFLDICLFLVLGHPL